MHVRRLRDTVVLLVSTALLSVGWPGVSGAAIITTQEALSISATAEREQRVRDYLARDDVAAELARYGVDAATASARVERLTEAELAELAGRIDTLEAGGDAVGIIGAVFLVLIILELVGVTDIFKAF